MRLLDEGLDDKSSRLTDHGSKYEQKIWIFNEIAI